MRITGGRAKGRRLHTPKGLLIRPTSDRVREAVFNILGHDLAGLNVLDLFSGTGSLGLEALSRGAERAVFVDRSRDSMALARKNIDFCGYGGVGEFIRTDLAGGIPWTHPILVKHRFDLVFLDPPYSKSLVVPVLNRISPEKGLRSGARVVVETERGADLPASFPALEMVDTRVYGDTRISFYESRHSETLGIEESDTSIN